MAQLVLACLGGALGAGVTMWIYRRTPTHLRVLITNTSVCAFLGALTAARPYIPGPIFEAGFFSTTAPITSVLLSSPVPRENFDVLTFVLRRAAEIALNLVYGTVFALLGFLVVTLLTGPPL